MSRGLGDVYKRQPFDIATGLPATAENDTRTRESIAADKMLCLIFNISPPINYSQSGSSSSEGLVSSSAKITSH